jgi:roadblock/LC7 domain-containing protein
MKKTNHVSVVDAKSEVKARLNEERCDNDGRLVGKKISEVKSELRSLLCGAPKVVKDSLASEYGAVMTAQDYEISAWFAGYQGDIGEFLTIKELGQNLDKPYGCNDSVPFYVACATGRLELVEYIASTPGIVDLNSRNVNGATPFFAACNKGHHQIVHFLSNKRAGDDFAIDIEVC